MYDPWADEQTPATQTNPDLASRRKAALREPTGPTTRSGGITVASFRSSQDDDDDGVVTSAAPLETTLRKIGTPKQSAMPTGTPRVRESSRPESTEASAKDAAPRKPGALPSAGSVVSADIKVPSKLVASGPAASVSSDPVAPPAFSQTRVAEHHAAAPVAKAPAPVLASRSGSKTPPPNLEPIFDEVPDLPSLPPSEVPSLVAKHAAAPAAPAPAKPPASTTPSGRPSQIEALIADSLPGGALPEPPRAEPIESHISEIRPVARASAAPAAQPSPPEPAPKRSTTLPSAPHIPASQTKTARSPTLPEPERPATPAPPASTPPAAKPASGSLPPEPPAAPVITAASTNAPRAPGPFSQTARSASASSPPPARTEVAPSNAPAIEGLPLTEVEELADLPEELQRQLAALARVDALAADEEVAGFGAVLVLEGSVNVCATIVDIPALEAGAKTLVPGMGTLAEGVTLRAVGGTNGARVAVWMASTFEPTMKLCPWVLDELRQASDRIQARAGATMGPLEALDDASRQLVLNRLSVRTLRPLEIITEANKPMAGLAIVGVGTIELLDGDPPCAVGEARPGDALFPDAALMGANAPQAARAGSGGAIVLIASRQVALDLLSQVPPLIDVLSR